MPSAQSICRDLQKVFSRIPISTVSQRLCLSMCSGLHIILRQTSPTYLLSSLPVGCKLREVDAFSTINMP